MDRDRFRDSLVVEILERMSDACVFLDERWRYIYVNQRAAALFGRRADDLVGKHIWTEFPEGVGQPFQLAYEAAMADQQPRAIEAYYPPWDRWYENRIFPCPDGLAIFFGDVTERRVAAVEAEKWAIAHDRAEAMAHLGLWTWSIDTDRVIWSRELYRIFGEEPSHAPSYASYLAHVHEADRDVVQRAVTEALETGHEVTFEHRAVRPDGAVRRLRCWGRSTRDARGRTEMFGTCLDLTDVAEVTEALRRSEEWLARAMEAGHVGLWEWIVSTGEVHWSRGVEQLFGLPPRAFGGTMEGYLALVHPDDRARVMAALDEALRDLDGYSVVHRTSPSVGPVRWLSGRGQVFREGDVAVRISGSVADITPLREAELERGQAQDRLRHLEKMEMLGRLAAGIAHDFNNLLTVVRTGAEVLAIQYPDDPLVTHVVEASERAAGLTGKLVDLARRRRAPLAEVDLNAILSDMQAMIRSSVPSSVTIASDLDPLPVVVFGDRDQLEQIVLNLVLNARDAMPEGGRLFLRTRNVGDDVLLDVEDTGHGITPDVAEQIFEPFFTTKDGHGTGLGLANVRELVTQHRGTIGVESAPGAGARFRVRLPRALPPARPQE